MDRRTLFVCFRSKVEAAHYRDEVRRLFDEHVAFLKSLARERFLGWRSEYRNGVTPPMQDFATQAGFTWSSDDALFWDDDDLAPALDIYAVGQLAIVTHGACLRIGQDGLRAFATRKGATAKVFWDPDPVPLDLRVTLGSTAAEEALLDAARNGDFYYAGDDAEVLTSQASEHAGARAVFVAGDREHHLSVPRALEDLLSPLRAYPDVDVELSAMAVGATWSASSVASGHGGDHST